MTGWTEEGLARSWRALAKADETTEWQFIHLVDVGTVAIKAGCSFPGSREALIVSFPDSVDPGPGGLTDGRGFDVVRVTHPILGNRCNIGLIRRIEGSQDIFASMVCDVVRAIERVAGKTAKDICDAFLGRVADWQEFMDRRRRPLSPERQVGLMGELVFLDKLRQTSLGAEALHFWQGPLKSAQDFLLSEAAVEVKSTISGKAARARINSIEQLDCDHSPMVLCAMRFEETADGTDLPSMVGHLRSHMHAAGLARFFDALLLQSGYDDEHDDFYGRKFRLSELTGYVVEDDFPCVRRAHLPPPVRSANYILDLEAIETTGLTLDEILAKIGAATRER